MAELTWTTPHDPHVKSHVTTLIVGIVDSPHNDQLHK